MAMNDAVDWRADLGGGVHVALVQAGTFRSDAGSPVRAGAVGPVGRARRRRGRRQAPAAPGAQLPADRNARAAVCSSRRASASASTTRPGRCVPTRARGSWRRWRRPGSCRRPSNVVAMSHLHFDHAGGLLRADGSRAFPHAKIVAQKAEWEVALGDNPRLVASYVQPELELVKDWGAQGWADGEREVLPGVSVVPTGGHSTGHQAIVVRGAGKRRPDPGLLRGPVDAAVGGEPALGDRVRRLPAGLRWPARPSCSRRPRTRAGPSCCRMNGGTRSVASCVTGTGSASSRSRAARGRGRGARAGRRLDSRATEQVRGGCR